MYQVRAKGTVFEGLDAKLEREVAVREQVRSFRRVVVDQEDPFTTKPLNHKFPTLIRNAAALKLWLDCMTKQKKKAAPTIPIIHDIVVGLFERMSQPLGTDQEMHRYYGDLKRLLLKVRKLWITQSKRPVKAWGSFEIR